MSELDRIQLFKTIAMSLHKHFESLAEPRTASDLSRNFIRRAKRYYPDMLALLMDCDSIDVLYCMMLHGGKTIVYPYYVRMFFESDSISYYAIVHGYPHYIRSVKKPNMKITEQVKGRIDEYHEAMTKLDLWVRNRIETEGRQIILPKMLRETQGDIW